MAQYVYEELPPLRGFHFIGPSDSRKWIDFVDFLRATKITLYRVMDSDPGEYSVYVSDVDAKKVREWFVKEGVLFSSGRG